MYGPSVVIEAERCFEPEQKSSHVAMTHDASEVEAPPAFAIEGRVDAIVVPAARGAAALDSAANLSSRLDVPLVVLCSRGTDAADAAKWLERVPDCRALVVHIPSDYQHKWLPTRTAAEPFQEAGAGRQSDLSLKRNLGLLLARLHGWGKILFLDDDISDRVDGVPLGIPTETARRLAAELDVRQIAGLACDHFPDNSVVCHARRLAGYPQDTFVSGAALGVNCDDQPVPFFPDVYNEDWFFFSPLAAERNLGFVGNATQEEYDPYANPRRARQEEFGDLLAEGLYALFEQQPAEMNYYQRLDAANESYWEKFIAARRETLTITWLELHFAVDEGRGDDDRYRAALRSLEAAEEQLSTLTPDLCTKFIGAWVADLLEWQRTTREILRVGSTEEALAELGLHIWSQVRTMESTDDVLMTGVA